MEDVINLKSGDGEIILNFQSESNVFRTAFERVRERDVTTAEVCDMIARRVL